MYNIDPTLIMNPHKFNFNIAKEMDVLNEIREYEGRTVDFKTFENHSNII